MVTIFIIVFGCIIGSFLNVIIYRLPRGESIVLPPSHCPNCQHRLGAWDLFPVFSYLLLRAKCKYCHTKISFQYPAMECLTGLMTFIWWNKANYIFSFENIVLLILTYALLVVAVIDFKLQIIPDKIIYPMIGLGLLTQFFQGNLINALLGLLISGGLLLMVYLLFPNGMGLGDVKYMAMVGVFIGWQKAIGSLLLGSFLGVLIMVPLLLLGKANRKTPFAFGPFLVLGALIVIYGWDKIVNLI